MGIVASAFHRLFGAAERQRLLMLGLDAAGKSTILYKLRLGEVTTTIPMLGLTVEHAECKNVCFTAMEVGGRIPRRPLMRHFYKETSGLIFVVDSSDPERLEQAADELNAALDEESLAAVPLLIFANKADLPSALSTVELAQKLGAHGWRRRSWYIQSCIATTGEGLYEGLYWLTTALKRKTHKELSKTLAVAQTPAAAQTPPAPKVLPANQSDPKGGASDTESTADTDRSEL